MNLKLFCLIFFPFVMTVAKAQLNANEIYKLSSNYIVSIQVQDKNNNISTGTGFYFANINAIVTNYHVIKDYQKIRITYFNGKHYEGPFKIETDSKNDIALLKSTYDINFKGGLNGETNENEIGEKIFVIGNPLGLNNTVTEGIISSIRKDEKNDLIQFTAPVSHGSSGSPVLNESGQVIGIVSFQFEKGQNLNFAIPIKYVLVLAAKYSAVNTNNEDSGFDYYSSSATNELLILADSLFDARNGNQTTQVVKALLKRSDIQDSLFVQVALKAIKQKFFLDLDRDFLNSYSNNFYYFYNRPLSIDDLDELLGKSIELTSKYSYNPQLLIKLYVTTGYYLLKENSCQYAYQYFKAALNVSDTSLISLNGMSDFYRAYSKEVSNTTDTNYSCKEKPLNFAESDSIKYYLTKIIQYHPRFYDGYLKLIDFYFDERSTKNFSPNNAFEYFLKCYKLDSKNPSAFKNYFKKFFLHYRESKNLAIYQKVEEFFSKYSQSLEYRSTIASFLADQFKDYSSAYDYKSKEWNFLRNKAIIFYKKLIDFYILENKRQYSNSKIKNSYQGSQDSLLFKQLEKNRQEIHLIQLCEAYLTISKLYMDLGNYSSAYIYIDKSLKVNPGYFKNKLLLGDYYLSKSNPDYKQAILTYEEYLMVEPQPDYITMTNLATCYYFNNDLKNAEKYFTAVKDECGECYSNSYLLALLYIELGKRDDAIKLYNELVKEKQYDLSDDLQKKLYPK